jgi:hypothetical protein
MAHTHYNSPTIKMAVGTLSGATLVTTGSALTASIGVGRGDSRNRHYAYQRSGNVSFGSAFGRGNRNHRDNNGRNGSGGSRFGGGCCGPDCDTRNSGSRGNIRNREIL